MALVRKYKISLLLNKPLEGRDGEIIDLIKSKLENLTPFNFQFENGYYIDSLYYLKPDGECILELNEKQKTINVKSHSFVSVLEDKYELETEEIYDILKYLIQDKLKLDFDYEINKSIFNAFKIKEAFLLEQSKNTIK